MSRNEDDFGGSMEMTSIPQGRRRNTNRTYTNLDSDGNNINQYSNQNTTSDSTPFTPPVPESLRPTYNPTYISPEPNVETSDSHESNVPPQIPANASYRYEYIPNTPSQSTNTKNSSAQSQESYIPPVPESLRPTYNPTYISPESKEEINDIHESHVPPQIPANASYRYEYIPNTPYQSKNTMNSSMPSQESCIPPSPDGSNPTYHPNYFSPESDYPSQFTSNTSYEYEDVQSSSYQTSNSRPKERKYIDPFPEKEYERERKREKRNLRTNIPSQQETRSQRKDSNKSIKFILWVVAFLIIFCLSFSS